MFRKPELLCDLTADYTTVATTTDGFWRITYGAACVMRRPAECYRALDIHTVKTADIRSHRRRQQTPSHYAKERPRDRVHTAERDHTHGLRGEKHVQNFYAKNA